MSSARSEPTWHLSRHLDPSGAKKYPQWYVITVATRDSTFLATCKLFHSRWETHTHYPSIATNFSTEKSWIGSRRPILCCTEICFDILQNACSLGTFGAEAEKHTSLSYTFLTFPTHPFFPPNESHKGDMVPASASLECRHSKIVEEEIVNAEFSSTSRPSNK